MYRKTIYNHYKDRKWNFCLLERTTGWLCETQYELAANHLTIQVGESLNEGKKVLANIIPDNREKPVKVNQYCVRTWKPEVVNENILEGFRGAIVGYPTMQFSVQFNTEYSSNQNDSLISCDVIGIEGGQRSPHPAYGSPPFSINFYKFTTRGEVELIKKITDNNCRFTIYGRELNGQIPSPKDSILSKHDIMDFVQKCKTGYSGRPPHNWDEVLGNKKDDSTFDYLSFDIRKEFVFLTYTQNLHYDSGKIWGKDDEWSESTDRHLWATYRFQSSYHLIKFINQISQIADIIQQDKEDYFGDIKYLQRFKFKESISKSEFESITGIHLFESIITSKDRW